MEDNRIAFLATPGGKTEQLVRDIMRERQAAQDARIAYFKSKGADNLWASEGCVSGLVVKADKIPPGWRRDAKTGTLADGEIVVVPDGKQKATYKPLTFELRALPSLPGTHAFTSRLGADCVCTANPHGRGMVMLFCSFEFVGDKVIVSIPKPGEGSSMLRAGDKPDKQFIPPDCTQLKMSEYWALKETVAPASV